MQTLSILPCKFSSNIYVYRQLLSNWLSKFVDARNNLDLYILPPDHITQLDVLLQQHHFKFIEVKNTIELLEMDVETYSN